MSGKKEGILYRYLVKTDNKEKFQARMLLLLLGGLFFAIWIIMDFKTISDIMISQYTWYNIDPLPRIIAMTFIPAILILFGYLGINDYYQRKNKS